jgi:hypothetical protein
MKFVKKKTFYPFPVFEFNLPAGHTCPFARDCKIKVDRITGKFERIGTGFRCYAASAERFPAVRESRWENYEDMLAGKDIIIPKEATHVRIHSSGDFFSQEYFDKWLDTCRKNSNVTFWAFTKSIQFWVNRLGQIPSNLTLQASRGSIQDELIDKHNLKFAQVFMDKDLAIKSGLPIDTNDYHAMNGTQSFALLDNFKYSKKDKL